MLHSVATATPLRISFSGGGSDIPSYYRRGFGNVVNMAINQYVYVTAKRHSPLFGERYRISYSITETVDSVEAIQNDIVRECILFCGVEEPLQILTSSDLPSQSGLGSSSSFCVGLLNSLHELRGEPVSTGQLAEEACHIEIERLGKPIGKQDQYAAAFGGLNYIRFNADDSVSIESLPIRENTRDLIGQLFLVWTGVQRSADQVLFDQGTRAQQNTSTISAMVGDAATMRDKIRLGAETASSLGKALTSGWELKKSLGFLIDTEHIEAMVSKLHFLGSAGQKVAGAGGGGFILGLASEKVFKHIQESFGAQNVLRPGYASSGSWTLGRVN